jgi:hypothetical protein
MNDGPTGPEQAQGPYRLGPLLATSWRFYSARFSGLFGLFVLVNLPFAALALIRISDIPERTLILINTVIFIIQTIWVSLAIGVAANMLEGYLRDEIVGPLEGWKRLRQNMLPALAAGMVSSFLAIFTGQLFPPLLALVYGPPMLMQVIAVEGSRSLTDAWRKTKTFMVGHWMRVISYLMTAVLGAFVVFNLAASLVISITGDVSEDAEQAMLTALIAGIAAFTYPFIATVQYVAYADIAALDVVTPPASSRRKDRSDAPDDGDGGTDGMVEATEDLPEVVTLYDALGVRPTATQKQIRRGYDTRMKLTDPARHEQLDAAAIADMERKRAEAQQAFETLSDPGLRAEYDEQLR